MFFYIPQFLRLKWSIRGESFKNETTHAPSNLIEWFLWKIRKFKKIVPYEVIIITGAS